MPNKMAVKKTISPMPFNRTLIDKIIAKYQRKPGEVLGILEEVQKIEKNKYLPQETLEYISRKLNISLSRIYSVVTFYDFFNLKPQGKHCIQVCRGTACHTRGSKALLESLKDLLKVADLSPEDEHEPVTTADKKFTIRTVACFGQCALAPVVVLDNKIYSYMTKEKLRKLLKSLIGKIKK